MKEVNFWDYLIEKPVCLIFWDLPQGKNKIVDFFSTNTEIKEIKNKEELLYWLKIGKVKIIILAVYNISDAKEIKETIDDLPAEKRREIFVIFISPEVKTLDPHSTFVFGVNLLLNINDVNFIDKIYKQATQYWEFLYRPYLKTYQKLMEEI